MSTTVCEYPSNCIEGERLRVEQTARGCYELCRLDHRGRRIRSMTMQISGVTAAAHLAMARKQKSHGEDVVIGGFDAGHETSRKDV